MRTLVIGDIHSGLKALRALLKEASVSVADKLIFLGDYVDGWSEAAETVDFLIQLKESHNCILIRGNHDELCYEWLKNGTDNPMWRQHGGQATMNSYKKIDLETKKRHLTFYENLENYHIDSDNRLFLHAGFSNLKGVQFEYFQKTFYWDRTLWELALSLNPGLDKHDPWYPKRLTNYHEIYLGHTPVTRIGKTTPQQAANVWNIDTGAAFTGKLSAIDLESKEVFQSDIVMSLYPDETGRNSKSYNENNSKS